MRMPRVFSSRYVPNLRQIILLIIIIALIVIAIQVFPLATQTLPPERSEWAYREVQINDLNDRGFTGEGVVVGLIDTGIDLSHPELKHVKVIAWRDLVNRKLEPYDDDGHGTAMAGIIAGKTYGVAPEVSFVVVKAIDVMSGASDTDLVNAIRFCINEGADIISMSLGRWELRREDLGGPWQDSPLEDACNQASEKGIFIVAAAGNDGGENDDGEVSVPGIYDHAITVGAVDSNLKIASFSSEGDNDGKLPNIVTDWDPWEREDPNKKPEVVAPGVKIVAPGMEHKYYEYEGTSMAVPFVSAGLALILGELTEFQHENNSGEADINKVKNALMATCKDLKGQDNPHDNRYGYGLFQADDLYKELK
ncbi:S8 family peptidase [[Eubacterium] cellulosolvens]